MNAVEAYRRQVGSRIKLTREEETRQILAARGGSQNAWGVILRAHEYSVMQIAARFCGRGVDHEDLIQAGNLGLVKAVHRFDPDNPARARFDSYARYWIVQSVGQEIRVTGNMIRRPSTWWSPGRDKLLARCDAVQKAVLRGEIFRGSDSLAAAPEREESDHECARTELDEAIARLPDERLREVMAARMNGETLESIGDRIGRTRSRVQQLEQMGLRALRETMSLDPSRV